MATASQHRTDTTAILAGRTERLPGLCYKLAGPSNRYGLDVALPDTLDIDTGRMAVRIPFADGTRRDGVGDLLEVGGINLSRHVKNPICLFDHGKSIPLPIGLAEDPETNAYTVELDPVAKTATANVFFYRGKGLHGVGKDTEFQHALFCEQLYDLIANRYVRAGSIGYQVVKALPLQPDYDTGTPQGLHLLSVLMLECSAVVLPANGDTVRKVLGMDRVCGKALSPMLIKSLEPYAAEQTKVVSGYEGKSGEGPEEKLAKIAAESEDQETIGYGDVFWHPEKGEVWYVVGDWCESKYADPVVAKLASVPGVRKVTREAEGYPPKDRGWVQLHNKKREWTSNGTKAMTVPIPHGNLSKTDTPPVRWKPGLGAEKAMALRLKYRKATGRVRRLRKSSAGSGLIHVAAKDVVGVETAAQESGLACERLRPRDGLERIRLSGDDKAIDRLAQRFGHAVQKGAETVKIKKLPAQQKAMPEDNPALAAAEETVETETSEPEMSEPEEQVDEKYSAQVLRRMHQDATLLLEDYDSMRGPLEHAEIDGYLQAKLESLVEELEGLEKLFGKHHPDANPLGAGGQKDADTMDDDAVPATDDGEEEEVSEDDSVEGMKTKAAPTPQTKKQEVSVPRVETKELRSRYNKKKGVCPSCGNKDCSCQTGAVSNGGQKCCKLMPHHKRAVGGSMDFLKEVGEGTDFADEHRMKSYHYHKALEDVVADLEGEEDKPKAEDKAMVGSPEWAAEEMAEANHKSHPHREALQGASGFLRELSSSTSLADEHRQKAMAHHKALAPLVADEEELREEEEMTPQEEAPAAGMETKAAVKAYQPDILAKAFEKQREEIAFVRKLLETVAV